MKLEYAYDLDERRLISLATRPSARKVRGLCLIAAAMWFAAIAGFLVHLLDEGFSPRTDTGIGVSVFLASFLTFYIVLYVVIVRRRLRQMFRRRNCHRWEVNLDDDRLSMKSGDFILISPWRDVAMTYRIDDDALFLLNRFGPGTVIPDWSGHGVGRDELAAVLEKAGLCRVEVAYRGWRMLFKVMPVVLFLFCIVSCAPVFTAVKRLRYNAIRVELERRIIELVNGNTEHPENPLCSYFIRNGRNLLQRFVAESFTFDFKNYEYIFDEDAYHDKVGIAATEGDKVYLVFLPCGCIGMSSVEDWLSARQHHGACYTETERGKWLEKVLPIKDELMKSVLKEL